MAIDWRRSANGNMSKQVTADGWHWTIVVLRGGRNRYRLYLIEGDRGWSGSSHARYTSEQAAMDTADSETYRKWLVSATAHLRDLGDNRGRMVRFNDGLTLRPPRDR